MSEFMRSYSVDLLELSPCEDAGKTLRSEQFFEAFSFHSRDYKIPLPLVLQVTAEFQHDPST